MNPLRNLKLTVAYDGTDFHGFQIQKGTTVRTVQQELVNGWYRLTGEIVTVIGAGRTDAGVHALGQVVNVKTNHTGIPVERVSYALNSVLPDDVRIVGCSAVAPSFHARFDALKKVYDYRIYNAPFPCPLQRRYTHFVPRPLDVLAMDKAARYFEGRNDYAAVSGRHTTVHSTVRTIYRCRVQAEGHVITIRVEGDGFLYHMVRTIAGSLMLVGEGKRGAKWIDEVLTSKDRSKAGPTAPALGLRLTSVVYEKAGRYTSADAQS